MHFLRGLKNIFFKNRMVGFEKIAKGEFFDMPVYMYSIDLVAFIIVICDCLVKIKTV